MFDHFVGLARKGLTFPQSVQPDVNANIIKLNASETKHFLKYVVHISAWLQVVISETVLPISIKLLQRITVSTLLH